MKAFILKTGMFFALASGMLCFGATKLDVSQLREVPDGNYLMTLELNGKREQMNVKVDRNRVKCVNSSDPSLKNMEGEFRPHPQRAGVFWIRFRGQRGDMSQIWIFRSDGAAAIREDPDRGEHQIAVPVSGNSIEPPKDKKWF